LSSSQVAEKTLFQLLKEIQMRGRAHEEAYIGSMLMSATKRMGFFSSLLMQWQLPT
jgi:hypothetical protein